MARHAKNPTDPRNPGLLRKLWPFMRRRARPLDRVGPATIYPEQAGAYRVVGVARVPHLPGRLAGERRAGCWS